MSESAIYFVVTFTTLLLVWGLGYTFLEFRRSEAKEARARGESVGAMKARARR